MADVAADSGPFSRRAVMILGAVALSAFLGVLLLLILADDAGRARTAAANTFSTSAIGHRAFVNLLRKLEVPVVVSRSESLAKSGRGTLLILAEPSAGRAWQEIRQDLGRADNVLLILPKWFGPQRFDRPDWIAQASLQKTSAVQEVLRSLARGARVVRPETASGWRAEGFPGRPELPVPQLIEGPGLTPLVAAEEGILLAEVEAHGASILILSDPDLVSNHGLSRGANAPLAVEIVERLRGAEGAVIFDETIHGFLRIPSRWRSFLELPFAAVTFAAFCTLVVLGLAAWGRFGPPARRAPRLAPGKAGLIDNTTRLLVHAGHEGEVLQRYWRGQLRDLLHRLHVPPHLDAAGRRKWLAELERNRGREPAVDRLEETVALAAAGGRTDRTRLLALARELHDWKRDMLDGSRES